MTGKPFYHIINYRADPAGTLVESFTREGHAAVTKELAEAGRAVTD